MFRLPPIHRHPRWIAMLTFPFALFIHTATFALIEPPTEPLPRIDARQVAMPEGALADTLVAPLQRDAASQVRKIYPNLTLRWNPVTGTPKTLYTLSALLTPASNQEAPVVVRNFINSNRPLYGLSTDDLNTLVVVRNSASPGSRILQKNIRHALTHIALDQRWQGRQVYPATLVGSVTDEGKLTSLSGEVVPNLAAVVNATEPALTPLQALERAASSISATFDSAQHAVVKPAAGDERRQTLARGPDFEYDVPVRLLYYVVSRNDVRLVWEVLATRKSDVFTYHLMVDAVSGDILLRQNLTASDTPRWQVYFQQLNAPPVHPRDDMRPEDSPAPMSPGPAAADGTQGAGIAQLLIQTNGLPAASHLGWVPLGENTTTGNNVIAFIDRDGDETADAGEQPTANIENVGGVDTRTFNFTPDFTEAPTFADNENAAVTHVFILANWYHDRMQQLGFTEAAGNFQETNNTPDGVDGDPTKALVHACTDNSFFYTPPSDGTCCPRLRACTFTGPNPDRDAALDAEVMFHEFTHGLTNRIVGGPNVAGITGRSGQEGFSDMYGLFLLSQPGDDMDGNYAPGGYLTLEWPSNGVGWDDNYFFGIRHFPYTTDLCVNPLTVADIHGSTYDITPIASAGCAGVPDVSPWLAASSGSIHDVGEIWGLALWEVRANLVADHGWATGNELMLQLLTDSLFLQPEGPSMIESRDALLLADLARTGGANLCRIWEGFAKRGFGIAAQVSNNYDAVTEDFTAQTAASCRPLLDMALLLDFSDSMNSPEACETPPNDIKIDVLKQAVPAFLNAWEPFAVSGDRIGVMYFDDDADPRTSPLLEDLLSNKAAILADVAARATGIYTAMGPAILSTGDSLDNRVRKRHMIVLSDGIQNVNPLVTSAGDIDGDAVDEHEVINGTPSQAYGGTSATVAPQPGKYLQDFGAPMHTLSIGSGPGTTYDELLAAISEETGGLHQHTCVPQVELEEFLTTSLVEALQGDTLELVDYTTGSLANSGATQEHRFTLNGSATRAAFLLSWSGGSGNANDVNLTLYAPDGTQIPLQNYLTAGSSFKRVTLDFPLFVGIPHATTHAATSTTGATRPVPFVGEWRLVAQRNMSGGGAILHRAYALVDDAALEYQLDFAKPVVNTGEPLTLLVRVTEAGKPVLPDSITAKMTTPRTGLGTVIFGAGITDADRQRIANTLGHAELKQSPLMQTYEVALRDPANRTRLQPVVTQLQFFDDGQHGDGQANDGLYGAQYEATQVPGEYQVTFEVSGESEYNGAYTRTKTTSATVVLREVDDVNISFEIVERVERGGMFQVLVAPQDRFGNYVGPGYAQHVQMSFENATPAGEVRDLLDGRYSQTFRTANFQEVGAGEAQIFGSGVTVPGLVTKGGFSLHAGMVTPYGSYSNTHDSGGTVNIDYTRFLRPDLAWDVRLGFSSFGGKGSNQDLEVWTVSGNLKYYLGGGQNWRGFANGGIGLYALDPGFTELGGNLGAGLAFQVQPRLTLEITGNYHGTVSASPDLNYGQYQLGLIYDF